MNNTELAIGKLTDALLTVREAVAEIPLDLIHERHLKDCNEICNRINSKIRAMEATEKYIADKM